MGNYGVCYTTKGEMGLEKSGLSIQKQTKKLVDSNNEH